MRNGGFRLDLKDDIIGIAFLILIGFLISLPTFFLMCLVIFKIDEFKRPLSKRLVVALVILCLTCITFWIGFNDDLTSGRGNYAQLAAIFGSYVATSMASIFFYRIEKKPVPDYLKEFGKQDLNTG